MVLQGNCGRMRDLMLHRQARRRRRVSLAVVRTRTMAHCTAAARNTAGRSPVWTMPSMRSSARNLQHGQCCSRARSLVRDCNRVYVAVTTWFMLVVRGAQSGIATSLMLQWQHGTCWSRAELGLGLQYDPCCKGGDRAQHGSSRLMFQTPQRNTSHVANGWSVAERLTR